MRRYVTVHRDSPNSLESRWGRFGEGADLGARDKNGETALLEASRRGHDQIVETLKAHGAKE